MTEMTPEKLRERRHVIEAPEVLAAASAWEADRKELERVSLQAAQALPIILDSRVRIEALEKLIIEWADADAAPAWDDAACNQHHRACDALRAAALAAEEKK